LEGHKARVLYVAMSPDGTRIVTGSGDENIKFWNVFPEKAQIEFDKSSLIPSSTDIR